VLHVQLRLQLLHDFVPCLGHFHPVEVIFPVVELFQSIQSHLILFAVVVAQEDSIFLDHDSGTSIRQKHLVFLCPQPVELVLKVLLDTRHSILRHVHHLRDALLRKLHSQPRRRLILGDLLVVGPSHLRAGLG